MFQIQVKYLFDNAPYFLKINKMLLIIIDREEKNEMREKDKQTVALRGRDLCVFLPYLAPVCKRSFCWDESHCVRVFCHSWHRILFWKSLVDL